MPQKKKTSYRAQVKSKKEYMKRKRQHDAFEESMQEAASGPDDGPVGVYPTSVSMGLTPKEEKPLARIQASHLEKMYSPAQRSASPLGSLSAHTEARQLSPDSKLVCTPLRVPGHNDGFMPSPAGQAQIGFSSLSKDGPIETKGAHGFKSKERVTNDETKLIKTHDQQTSCKSCTFLDSFQSQSNPEINSTVEGLFADGRNKDLLPESHQYRTVQGNFHQAHPMFEYNAGTQCVSNCLVALSYHQTKNVMSWNPMDMDKILITGNELHSFLTQNLSENQQFLLVHELPNQLECFNRHFNYIIKDSIGSLIMTANNEPNYEDFNAYPMDAALQMSLIDSSASFVCFGGNTIIVGKANENFFVFDSHSRSHDGLLDINGRSTCKFMRSIADVFNHLKLLAASLGYLHNVECEFTGISVAFAQNNYVIDAHHQKEGENLDTQGVELLSESFHPIHFKPLSSETKKNLGNFSSIECPLSSSVVMKAGSPMHCEKITRDGNCFFRAISFCVTGSEDYHLSFRELVCSHLSQNEQLFASFLRTPYGNNMKKYMQSSKMKQSGIFASELEIFATCHVLKVDIFTFTNDKWLKFSGTQVEKSMIPSKESIYLNHINQNHYDVVLSVTDMSKRTEAATNNKRKMAPTDRLELYDTNSQSKKQKFTPKFTSDIQTMKAPNDAQPFNIPMKWSYPIVYRQNQSFRSKILWTKKIQYKYNRQNKSYTTRQHQTKKQKYKYDRRYRDRLRKASKCRYQLDEKHKKTIKLRSLLRYAKNKEYRKLLKEASRKKYTENNQHRANVQKASIQKYAENEQHRQYVKYHNHVEYSKQNVRRKKIDNAKTRYRNVPGLRAKMIKNTKEKRAKSLLKKKSMCYVVDAFTENAHIGPSCVCSSCQRLLFKNQVQLCKMEVYENNVACKRIANQCISTEYYHSSCVESCPMQCMRAMLWICKTCHRKILSGKMPEESTANNLALETVPEELSKLNSLEQHLVALHIPFMKVVALPQGGQNMVHGPVVCVPSDLDKTNSLPRPENENLILRVKLKRKITYKGYYEYQFVNTHHIHEALKFLQKNNIWYYEVQLNNSWENSLSQNTVSETQRNAESTEEGIDDQNDSLQFDSCLQPADIGQEVLDHYFDDVYNLAPAEGNNPIKILQENGNEAKSFPFHFPSGHNTIDEEREKRITLSRYLNQRLMNVDNRFAKDTNYIFYSQYISELTQVIEKTQISLRKSTKTAKSGKKMTLEMLQNPEVLRKLLCNDEALRFLQPIRGTPSYWQSVQKDLFAMLRQLGIPTWFCSFSAAEFRWTQVIDCILEQQGSSKRAIDLDWTEKSKVLKSNPVTVARMFEHRFSVFLRDVVFSPAEPIGKIIDFFHRVEFQQRGSPHMHCLFWVEDAPKLEIHGKDKVCAFIDRYVTCEIPPEDEDSELRRIVLEVQQHSKKHSKSCRKKGTECRFNFPRPPSLKTFISEPIQKTEDPDIESIKEEGNELHEKAKKNSKTAAKNSTSTNSSDMSNQQAKTLLQNIWSKIKDDTSSPTSVSSLFREIGIDQTLFELAYKIVSNKQAVVLQRSLGELWINQYNPCLLKCWNANMDIQYILDPFSCIVYIVSYISKAEREMGLLLNQTKLEAKEGNMNAKQTLRKIGSAYLSHREISVQEAVYRVCNLKMRECSRKVVFIPVGPNPARLSKPLSQIKKKTKEDSVQEQSEQNKDEISDEEDDDIWMTNIVERYLSRPQNELFQTMCLAKFCSDFRVLAKSQIPQKENKNVYKLQNNKGYIQKRTRTNSAIVRFPRFNVERNKEEYYQSILQLFLPYWTEKQLKPPAFDLYQTFYETGFVMLNNRSNIQAVKAIVDSNYSQFCAYSSQIDRAQDMYEELGEQEDAWAMLCPETEISRQNCLENKSERQNEDNESEQIPDLDKDSNMSNLLYHVQHSNIPRRDALLMMRSLNEKQKQVFYFIRNWALQKVHGQNPDPFHIFITGGAGTGKSHLIKSINYETSRLLSKIAERPDSLSVLLAAFTGTAAFNIGGCTLHHAFSLTKYMQLPYQPLQEQKLSALRVEMQNVQILVIDEVSMVYKRLLYYIHERLVQIKKCKRPFGGVSVLAVGDFFQLPPVKQPKNERLYKESMSCPVDLWQDLFSVLELNEIMRQKNDFSFAEMLNTLRKRTPDQAITQAARNMLTDCTREGSKQFLHIFATNEEVSDHNLKMIKEQNKDIVQIDAIDYQKDKTSGQMKQREKPFVKCQSEGLPNAILLTLDAKVMLIRNVDVSDGLVNGAIGRVMEIKFDKNGNDVQNIGIHFENDNTGRKAGKNTKRGKIVYIERAEEELDRKTATHAVRHQFPLKLAWACTAHKVQGMTVQNVVVNLDHIFSPGQAYVALSRVTSQNGLNIHISDKTTFEKSVYADSEIQECLNGMSKLSPVDNLESSDGKRQTETTIILHNIQNLNSHVSELFCDKRYHKADIICLTETWLKCNENTPVTLENYLFYHNPRMTCYNETESLFQKLKIAKGGGTAVFIKDTNRFQYVQCPVKNLEASIVKMIEQNLYITTIYRPNIYTTGLFLRNLTKLLDYMKTKASAHVLMGDFNEDILNKSGQIQLFMKENGYTQLVEFPTTESGTLIDHVYVHGNLSATVYRMPTYFSYHEAIIIKTTDRIVNNSNDKK